MIANNKVKLIGMTLVRVLTGVILFKFSLEMFSKDTMSGYIQWLGDIHFPFASKMAYVGKIAEMVGGLSLILGLFVRWTGIPVMITMVVITFVMGEGSITDTSF
ncbi:MAG: DoxX family protein [Saprospiraceae bacterium]|jgi:putative oxidoreductase|nr:DoxX family protein [Saprospiraceae bacterium]MBP8096342.1 DoxX family protein [Saprospiraceae bacterium]